jgi:hypothetical protein
MKVDKSIKFKECQSFQEFVDNIKYNMNIMWRDTLMIKKKLELLVLVVSGRFMLLLFPIARFSW